MLVSKKQQEMKQEVTVVIKQRLGIEINFFWVKFFFLIKKENNIFFVIVFRIF